MVNNHFFQFGEINSAHAFPHHFTARLHQYGVRKGSLPLRVYRFNERIFVFGIENIIFGGSILLLKEEQRLGSLVGSVG